MDLVRAVFAGPRALPRWAVASLIANIGIVLTGGVVRLTGSGLGCPTWPRCTAESLVPHPALGIHGAIEFGNRLLTFVLILIALGTLIAALLRRQHRPLAVLLAAGIPAQGVIGGISVLTRLNPYVVSLHLVASLGLIAAAVALVRRSHGWSAGPPALDSWRDRWGRRIARSVLVAMVAVVLLGTLVTGGGPHAGDADAPRNSLDPGVLSQVHAGVVYLTVGLTLGAVWLLRSRASVLLLGVELVQAGIGIAQYRLGLPVELVALHLLGAALSIAAATNLALSVGRAVPATPPQPNSGSSRRLARKTAAMSSSP